MKWENLLFNLVQIGLTVSLAALVPLLLRRALKKRYPARAMCLVWAVLAARLLVPVQLTLPEPPVSVDVPATVSLYLSPPTYQYTYADGTERTRLFPLNRRTVQQAMDSGEMIGYEKSTVEGPDISWTVYAFALWLLGAAGFLVVQIGRYREFDRALRWNDAAVRREDLRDAFEREKQSLGIKRAIPLRASGAADCPMLAGFLRPALYLPDENLSVEDASFIFRHELTHYKHGDLWLKLLLIAARAVQWFNPLIHIMARFAYEDIELACDDAVAKNMDGAERRAYGETILRSAAAQVKRRTLISCFTGDKETLLRRFEGLFDKRAKKRGAALVLACAVLVGAFGCAVSVGGATEELTQEEMIRLVGAQAEARRENGFTRYAVVPETDTALLVLTRDGEQGGVPLRIAERYYFKAGKDGWEIDRNDIAADKADSLENFRLLYENDLGLPDFIAGNSMAADSLPVDISDPQRAAVSLLSLEGGAAETLRREDVTHSGTNDLAEVRYTFADGSTVRLQMMRQFDDARWLPQAWTDEAGRNDRAAVDLAQQYARAVLHESGQYLYPNLSDEKAAALLAHWENFGQDGVWYWKFGGSSPTVADYTLVPTDDPNAYIAVFQLHGGGMTDYRTAQKVLVGKENGRSVITGFEEYDSHLSWMLGDMAKPAADYTKSEIFNLYYNSGLPWPAIPDVGNNFNGAPLESLTQPLSAVESVFAYFGEQEEQLEGDSYRLMIKSWFTADLVSQGTADAVVRLTFTDGSTPIDVQMRKNGDYWLPTGIAVQYDEVFHAWINGQSLPTGATVEAAAAAANGNIPVLTVGETVKLEPLDGKAAGIDCTLFDAVIRADGTPQYDDRVTEQREILVEAGSYPYRVERNGAEALSSALTRYTYRGVTVRYAFNGTPYTASFVFRTENPDAQQEQDRAASHLQKQGEAYARAQSGRDGGFQPENFAVTPETADNACTVWTEWRGGQGENRFRTVERVWFADENALAPARAELLLDTSDGVRSAADFLLAYKNDLHLPIFSLEEVENPGEAQAPLSTPEDGAAYVLHLAGGTRSVSAPEETAENMRTVAYTWGEETLYLTARRIRLGADTPVLWLPDDWRLADETGQTVDGLGRQYSPYDLLLAHATAYYRYRTTDELLWYMEMEWADGAYAEGVLAELDRRSAADPDGMDAAIASYEGVAGGSALR